MNLYSVWIAAIPESAEVIAAESSFAARKVKAAMHGCEVTDCAASRIRTAEETTSDESAEDRGNRVLARGVADRRN